MQLCYFRPARVEGCDFGEADLCRTLWDGAEVHACSFRGALVNDSILGSATFTGCDFRGAELRCSGNPKLSGGTVYGTRFERCDLRDADIDGLKLKGTVFIGCAFDGVRGRPVVEGPYIVEAPDFSAGFDGSDVLGPERLHALWGRGA
jgi:uncharacterized protein YjbI with pentapeptide repeats